MQTNSIKHVVVVYNCHLNYAKSILSGFLKGTILQLLEKRAAIPVLKWKLTNSLQRLLSVYSSYTFIFEIDLKSIVLFLSVLTLVKAKNVLAQKAQEPHHSYE